MAKVWVLGKVASSDSGRRRKESVEILLWSPHPHGHLQGPEDNPWLPLHHRNGLSAGGAVWGLGSVSSANIWAEDTPKEKGALMPEQPPSGSHSLAPPAPQGWREPPGDCPLPVQIHSKVLKSNLTRLVLVAWCTVVLGWQGLPPRDSRPASFLNHTALETCTAIPRGLWAHPSTATLLRNPTAPSKATKSTTNTVWHQSIRRAGI